jgi:hypothetical protein
MACLQSDICNLQLSDYQFLTAWLEKLSWELSRKVATFPTSNMHALDIPYI